MLKNPTDHFVHLRRVTNPLVTIVNSQNPVPALQIITNNLNLNTIQNEYNNLLNFILQYRQAHGLLDGYDLINFLDYLETLPAPPPLQAISKNLILYGPPGTGKTYNTVDKALEIIDVHFFNSNKNDRSQLKNRFDELVNKNILFVTFHQSYSYEEFVEGIRAETINNNISYSVKPGIFKKICKEAESNGNKNFVLIIDEINRGNISKIFGELITLIEESKRAGGNEKLTVTLPYSNEPFSVPNNLYIIGTMNTADRSLALMDTALRRRFDFIEMMPDIDLLYDDNGDSITVLNIEIAEMLETMNKRIEVLYDREHTLGHAFFIPLIDDPTIENLAGIFKNKIIPLLKEYFFEDWEKIRIILGDDTKSMANQFIQENTNNLDIFSDTVKTKYRLNDVKSYSLNDSALISPVAYIGIYQ
jgi:5-methylcytosine-specific restriction endonuclease McrBC GTP-binding regulatory subunit McrB